MPGPTIETHPYDVLVIGAGGAGLRAAIEARAAGATVGLVCKSLLGKAHTVMAEGGVAAALRNVADEDSWQIHFRDTMVGGKLLNQPRMAELHAQEAPARVNELERWGAVFDRTRDGKILQRSFGGHSHPRLAHVGDRTGLEMIRTLQDQAVAAGIDVYMECTITHLTTGLGRTTGAFGYWRATGRQLLFPAKAIVLATGGIGKAYEVTSNSWEYSGDGQALAYRAGAELIDMEFVQFHPTGMVWPPGVRGLLVTEAVRGEGGILRNSLGERFMWKYLPEDRRAEYAATDEEAARWVTALSQGRTTDARRPPELSTRDNVARAIYTEVKEGRGSPHGGVFLDISYLPADHVRRKLPSMYEQFKELADVDITTGPMEVGPTTHYVMGGIRVDPDTGATTVPGLFAAGEVAGGMHGANRLGGNSLSDLLVFGARTGAGAAALAASQDGMPHVDPVQVEDARRELTAPFERTEGEDPYAIQRDLQTHDAAPGRDLPHRRGSRRRAGRARGPSIALGDDPRVGRAGLQPGLEPRLRAAQPADRVGVRHPQRPAADGKPGSPQPARLSRDGRSPLGRGQLRDRPRFRRGDAGPDGPVAVAPRGAARIVGRTLSPEATMVEAHFRVFRGSPGTEGHFDEFDVPAEEGMVVLDALHWIQGHEAPDLAVRWNCKAAKCGSCSAEVDGRPSLTCKTRLSDFDLEQPITVEPMRAFPLIRDLVTDVSWNYRVNETIQPFTPPDDVPQEDWRWQQQDIERVQEYRKCIECFLCQDVCHVLRNHETQQPFMGPRFLVRAAGLEMHPIDQADRREYLKDSGGIGFCNITKCCTEVCPEHIKITDNAIIPLKERVADKYYDPLQFVWRLLRGGDDEPNVRIELPVLPHDGGSFPDQGSGSTPGSGESV